MVFEDVYYGISSSSSYYYYGCGYGYGTVSVVGNATGTVPYL